LRDDFGEEPLHPGHRSIRLRGYDYTPEGLYFITICSHEKHCIFGNIVDAQAILSPLGRIVHECWVAIPLHFAETRLHTFVIMPNHLHGIVEICAKRGRSSAAPLGALPCSRVHWRPSCDLLRRRLANGSMRSCTRIGSYGSEIILRRLFMTGRSSRRQCDTSSRIRRGGSGTGRIRRQNRIGNPAEWQVVSRLAALGRSSAAPLLEGGA
jgi:hypothetical protein